MDILLPGPTDIINVKQMLLKGWQHRMSQKRVGIHVSDLILCRRRVCFERIDPNPPSGVDEKKVKYFMAGEEKHRNLQALLEHRR